MILKRHIDQIVECGQFFSEHYDKMNSESKLQEFKIRTNNDVKIFLGQSNCNLRSNTSLHKFWVLL